MLHNLILLHYSHICLLLHYHFITCSFPIPNPTDSAEVTSAVYALNAYVDAIKSTPLSSQSLMD